MCDENCNCSRQKRSGGLLRGLFTLGTIIGTAFFLFKTEEGEEVRKKAKQLGDDVRDKMEDVIEDLSERGKELKDKAMLAEEDLRGKVKEVSTEKREELEEKLARIKDEASSLWEKIQDFSRDVQKSAVKRFGKTEKRR